MTLNKKLLFLVVNTNSAHHHTQRPKRRESAQCPVLLSAFCLIPSLSWGHLILMALMPCHIWDMVTMNH